MITPYTLKRLLYALCCARGAFLAEWRAYDSIYQAWMQLESMPLSSTLQQILDDDPRLRALSPCELAALNRMIGTGGNVREGLLHD